MKRAPALALLLLITAFCTGTSGCARQASTQGEQRLANPSLGEPLGPSGLSRDSKSYMANDPP